MAIEWEAVRYRAQRKRGAIEVIKSFDGWYICTLDQSKGILLPHPKKFDTAEEALEAAPGIYKSTLVAE